MMNPVQNCQLAATISDQAKQLGIDVSPEQVLKRLDQPSMLIGDTYRVVTETVIPAVLQYAGELYGWYMGTEAPQTSLENRKLEALDVAPQMKVASEPQKTVEAEEKYYDPEWDGLTDADYKDCVESMDTPKTEKPAEEAKTVSKKAAVAVEKEKTSKTKGPKVGFGSHVPPSKSRKDGMTDREYMNKFESNIRSMEDPLKPKKARKQRFSSRLQELSKAKNRSEDLHLSQHDIEMRFRNSLRK